MTFKRNGDHPCIICGLECNPKTAKYLHMTTAGEYVSEDYNEDESQGCFPIGSDCLRKQSESIRKLAFKPTWR